jgi:hypothetical protein
LTVLALDATYSSGFIVAVVGGVFTFAGAVTASLIATRRAAREPREPKRVIPRPKRVTHSDRLHSVEEWRRQYADPLLHRLQNLMEWDGSDKEVGGDD